MILPLIEILAFPIATAATTLLCTYFCLPYLVKHSSWVQRQCIFQTALKCPFTNYTNPSYLPPARNFYLSINRHECIGVWHVLPKSSKEYKNFEAVFADKEHPVIIYCHGTGADRTLWYRKAHYKVLSELGYNVLALDYRGFGDSDGEATAEQCVEDVCAIYEYAVKQACENKVVIWGTSLGTAITLRAMVALRNHIKPPHAFVLESPFNNLRDLLHQYPFVRLFRFLPHFESALLSPLEELHELIYHPDRIAPLLGKQCPPVLVLHAEDDKAVGVELMQRLVQSFTRDVNVTVKLFPASRRYGHTYIHNAPELSQLLDDLIDSRL